VALIVQKYGGTSVGSPERIKNVARRVAKFKAMGHKVVVVVSAMSGETNRLLGLAKEVSPEKMTGDAMRELDMIAATGEQVSVGLLALALQAEGLQAVSYAGWQVPIETDSAYTKARIERIDDTRVRADLAAGKVVIITGRPPQACPISLDTVSKAAVAYAHTNASRYSPGTGEVAARAAR